MPNPKKGKTPSTDNKQTLASAIKNGLMRQIFEHYYPKNANEYMKYSIVFEELEKGKTPPTQKEINLVYHQIYIFIKSSFEEAQKKASHVYS